MEYYNDEQALAVLNSKTGYNFFSYHVGKGWEFRETNGEVHIGIYQWTAEQLEIVKKILTVHL